MKYGSYNRGSRSEMRGKRRKTNLILNMLIGIVLLLIIIVSSIIFLGGNDDTTAEKKQDNQVENEQENVVDNDVDNEEDENIIEDEGDKETAGANEEEEENQSDSSTEKKPVAQNITPADKEDEVVTAGGENENVKSTIVNPSWEPIGTSQVGEHTSVFERDSADWTEMIQAITYATGVDESNMTIWFVGNNGHNRAVGTISSKDQQEKYRVYIDWVDGKGWKPTKVEELFEIDKKHE